MVTEVSDFMLYVSLVSVGALALVYGLLQPWWRSWFGVALILTLVSLFQIQVRAALTMYLGEEYAGRDWVLLLGRVEIALGATIALTGLGWELLKAWRATRRPEVPASPPPSPFEDSSTH